MKISRRIRTVSGISIMVLALVLVLSNCGKRQNEGDSSAGSGGGRHDGSGYSGSGRTGGRYGGGVPSGSRYDRSGNKEGGLHYIGRESCRECHQREYELFLGSDHDMAMDTASEETVLGNFDDCTFEHLGIRTHFFRQDGRFMVHTQGAGGEWKDFIIAYVFGIRPLQQYLVEFPKGAYQMLPFCWDTRPAEEGGQHWFNIYGQERIPPEDILYWTHITQNWNYMCSECHSTNVRKAYNYQDGTYHTTWSEIDVSCEACHGPGSRHEEWARIVEQGGNPEAFKDMGLAIRLKDADNASWVFDMETGTARRSVPRQDRKLVEMCARCHARRAIISEDYVFGKSFLDTHNPSLLDEGLYFADGQILEEVYVYASFLQSKMYRNGVVCKDCHEPHSGKVFVHSNALCYRCHLAEKYGSRAHHFHDPEKEGSSCLECHMPERTYMVIDPRRDHSIRIPRPDLSDRLKSPNACNKCHSDKSNRWAADWCRKWYGDPGRNGMHYGEVFWEGRQAYPEALPGLIRLAGDPESAPMVKATAISLLQNYQDPSIVAVLRQSLSDPDPLIRYAAVTALFAADDNTLLELAVPRLSDSVRLIRTIAAFQLARLPDQYFGKAGLRQRQKVTDEYIRTQMINADHPSAHMNLGILALNRGDYAGAEASYRKAIEIEPALTTAYVNLADLYRVMNRDREGEQVLRNALKRDPDMAAVNYALGLNLVRRGAHEEAMTYLERASRLEPGNARYAYVYGVGLHSTGKPDKAVAFLTGALRENPYDRDLLFSLSTFNQELGKRKEALEYAEKLVEYYPSDQNYRQLIQYLMSGSD
jgi:tetratricopeptide (TPR) repeat protein